MPETALTRPRSEATVTDAGAVLCTCGKKIAELTDNEIEWKCKCGTVVYLPNEALFLRNCHEALATISHIITVMASRRPAA